MAISPTAICNMALGRIGAQRINSLEDTTDTKLEAIHCRLHYTQTRDALQRSHFWRFNKARATLSEDTNTPDFEWGHQFYLPNDFLRMRSVFDENTTPDNTTTHSYSLEGSMLLTDDSSVKIRYSKLITDPTQFDPLFIEIFYRTLANKLIIPLSQDVELKKDIDEELVPLMAKVRALDREEGDTIRRNERRTWNDARYSLGGRIDSQLGS